MKTTLRILQPITVLLLILLSSLTAKADNYYWVGGSGNWSDFASHWATTSGGTTFRTQVPTSNDDVFFDANSFTAAGQIVNASNTVIFLRNMNWTGATFNPQLSQSTATSNINIFGSLTLISAMNFNVLGSVVFLSNVSGNSITSAGQIFKNRIDFEGLGGGWTLQDSLTLNGSAGVTNAGLLSLNFGALNTNGKTVRCLGFSSTNANVRSLNMSNSSFIITANGSLNPWNTSSASNFTLTATGSSIFIDGTYPYIYFYSNNLTYNNLYFTLAGALQSSIQGSGNTFNGNVLFAGINNGTGGNTFNGNLTFNNNATLGGGNSTCNGVTTFLGDGLLTSANTINGVLNFTAGKTYTLTSTLTQSITATGTLNAVGTCILPITIKSSSSGSPATINKVGGNLNVDQAVMQDIRATVGATFSANATNSFDGGNNNNWIFPAFAGPNMYWVGGSGNWNDPTHWSFTSGGTPGSCIPGPGNDVFFDANSFTSTSKTVTMNTSNANCKSMNWTGAGFTPTFASSVTTNTLRVYGSMTLIANMNLTYNGSISFDAKTTGNSITSAGKVWPMGAGGSSSIFFNGAGGSWIFVDAFSTNNVINLLSGSLNSNNQAVNCFYFDSQNSNVRSLNMGSSTWTLSGYYWLISNSSNLTLNALNSTIKFTYPYGVSFYGANQTYNIVSFEGILGSHYMANNNIFNGNVTVLGDCNFASNCTFNAGLLLSAGRTYNFSSGTTQTISSTGFLTANGTCANYIVLKSSNTGQVATISKVNGNLTVDNAVLQDIRANVSVGFLATATNKSTNAGGNINWNFSTNTGGALYWVGGTGNWNDPTHWSTSSGGVAGTCTPGPTDDVFFDANSFTNTSKTVTINVSNAYCKNMNWTGAGFTPTLGYSVSGYLRIAGSLTLITAMNLNYYGTYSFESTTAGNIITSAGKVFPSNVYFAGVGGTWGLADAFNTNSYLELTAGTLNTNNQPVTCSYFGTGSLQKALNLGSTVFTLTNYYWNVNASNFAFNAGTSTIRIFSPGNNYPLYGAGLTYYNVTFEAGSNPGTINGNNTFNGTVTFNGIGRIEGNNTFNGNVVFNSDGAITSNNTYNKNLKFTSGKTYTLTSGVAQTFSTTGTLTAIGSPCAPIAIFSSVNGSATTLTKASGEICSDYLYLVNTRATGGAIFSTGLNSTNSTPIVGTGWQAIACSTPLQSSIITASGPLCGSGGISLSSRAATSYLWSTGATTQSINITTPGTYTLSIVNLNGCSETGSLVITSGTAPTCSITGSSSTCPGTSETYTAPSGFANYVWTISGNASIPGSAIGETVVVRPTGCGSYTLSLTITNASGCSSTCSKTVSVTDNTPPAITCPSNISIGNATGLCGRNVTFAVTATDNCGTPTVVSTPASGSLFVKGNTTVTSVATDACGNTTTCTFVVTVTDAEAPVITCNNSGTINVSTDAGLCTYKIVGTTLNATATDNCGIVASLAYTLSGATSGTGTNLNNVLFNIGTTTVTWRATDSVGTISSCNFNINVSYAATPTIAVSGTTTFCAGGSVVLTASSGSSYLWSNGATTQSITVTNGGAYSVTVTNASGCCATSAATVVTVNAVANATITASGATTFCTGGSVALTAAVGASYAWSTGATTRSINVTTSGSYTVTVNNAAGCSSISDAVAVTVNATPTAIITASGATTFCAGSSVTLTASDGATYLWSNGATSQSITVTSGGAYTVAVTNEFGCSATSAATVVTVNPAATAIITASGANTFCAGGSVTLTATAGSTYTWSTGATSRSINVTTSGNYSVTVNTAAGCSAISTATTVTVNAVPTATITASGATTFCAGSSVTLAASDGTSYLWNNGATSKTITVTSGGSYSVVVSNEFGCSATSAATVVVVNAVPSITSTTPASRCGAGSVTLNATASAGIINWYAASTGGSSLATGSSFVTSTAGTYYVDATANGCTSGSRSAVVATINPQPTITASNGAARCGVGSVTLTATATLGAINWYTVSSGGSAIATGNSFTTPSLSSTTNYYVDATANGCASAARTLVAATINPVPSIAIAPATASICTGNSISLSGSSVTSTTRTYNIPLASLLNQASNCDGIGDSYYNGCAGTQPGFTWLDNGSGTVSNVQIKFAIGVECAATGTVHGTTLNNFAGPTFATTNWCQCAGQASTTANDFTINFTNPTYNVGGTNTFYLGNPSNCFGFIKKAVLNNSFAIVTVTYGGSSSNAAIASWLWNTGETTNSITVNPTTTTTYTLTGTTAENCSITSTKTVTVNPLPTTFNVTGGGSFCSGGNGVSIGLSGSQTGISYQLKNGSTNVGSPVSGNGSNISFGLVSNAATYTVVATNVSTGCSSNMAGNATVAVNQLPNAIISASGATTFCDGGSVNLTASAGTSYLWSNGATTQTITVSTAGNYSVTVTNASNCAATSSATAVTVNTLPVSTVTVTGSTTVCSGNTVTLNAPATAAGGNAMTFGGRYVTVPHSSSISLGAGTTYSIESWVRVSDNVNNTIVDKGDYNFLFQTHPNGNQGLGLYNRSFGWIYSAGTVPVNQWVHVAVTYDNRIVRFYQNGVLQGTYNASTNSTGDNGALNIGRQQPGFCNCNIFDGSMDELRLWNTARTQAQIQATMNATVPTNSSNLVAYYKFDAGSGTSVVDATSNANNGSVVGSPIWMVPSTSPLGGASTTYNYLWSPSGETTASINAATSGNYSVTLTDASTGCSSTSTPVLVTINTTPTITCPSNITVGATANMCGANVSFDSATVTGSPNPTITYSHASGSFFTVGTTEVTATAINSCGSTSCTFTVTVNDTQAPSITCTNDTSVIASSAAGATVNYTTPIGTDNCSGVTTTRTSGLPSGETFPIGTTTVTHKVTDAAGLTAECSFTVTVTGLPPAIVCPSNITVNNAVGQCGANVSFAATESQAIPASTISYSIASGSFFPVGTTAVTATATNAVGSSSCSFTVTVVDNQVPVLVGVPANATVECDAVPAAAVVTATDNCTTSVPTFTQTRTNGNCPSNYTLTRTWSTTDASNNTTTASQTITVQDTQAPILSAAPDNVTVECNAVPTAATLNATDNCDNAPVVTYNQTSTQNSNPSNVGHYNYVITRTWTATDACGNVSSKTQTITVQDVTAPIIACPSNVTLNCQDDNTSANTGVANAEDNCAPIANIAITQSQTSTQNADVNNAGYYNYVITRTWRATDVTGNYSECEQTITVQDVTKPVITCPTNVTLNCQDNNTSASTGVATATDNCSPVAITQTQTSTQNANPSTSGHYNYVITRTWTATDVTGNASSCVQTITVQDVTAPIIACPSNVMLNCQDNNTSAATGVATATDNCSPVTITQSQTSTQNASPNNAGYYNYVITRTWTATDVTGNASSCVQTITVQDVTAPLVTCPAIVTVNCQDNNTSGATGVATATDNCSPVAITQSQTSTQNADVNNAGHYNYVISRTWRATDVTGNFSECIQTITVQDITKPVITCPAIVTVNCQDNNKSVATGVATATDNCGPVAITQSQTSTQNADVNNAGHYNYVITRTWRATDVTGNFSECMQTITVQDITKPVITCPAIVTVNCQDNNTSVATGVATATDNCSPVAITQTQTSTQNADVNNAGYYNYVITRTWRATDVTGNFSECIQTITVQDVTAPVITCPTLAPVCNDLAGNTKTLTLTGTDNCNSPLTVSYTVSGATVKATTASATATVGYNVGTSYLNWTVKDATGNTTTCTTTVVIRPLPVASYVTSNADAFCNKLSITANSTLSGPYSYAWSYNNAAFATTQQIQLGNANGDGNYSVYTFDGFGCRSAVPAVYNYQKQNMISSYTILANKEVELHGYNSVQSGSVGLMKAEGKADFKKYSSMTGAGAFVKAPKIEVDNGASVPNRVIGIATVSLPTMQVNTLTSQQYNALPSYTVNQSQMISLSGNYKDLKIKKGANVTLSGTIFGKIDIEEGSIVRFTSTTINMGDMKVGKGPNNGSTTVRFANNTSVRVSKQVKIEEDCIINPDGVQVTFYLGDEKCDEEKFYVKGGNTTVTANIYAPSGKIKVTGGSNCHNHGNGGVVNMIGLFIADEVESEGKFVNWNNYTCTNSGVAPIANYVDISAPEETVAKLEVRVAPNPTMSEFVLIVNSKTDGLVNIKVTDAYGKLVATLNKVVPGSAVRVGSNFTSGIYFAEIVQGTQRKVVKMIKGN